MDQSARLALQKEINQERKNEIRYFANLEANNQTRKSFERMQSLYSFVDQIGSWKVGTDAIAVLFVERRSAEKGSFYVLKNGDPLGWGDILHAQKLTNEVAGKVIWTSLVDEI